MTGPGKRKRPEPQVAEPARPLGVAIVEPPRANHRAADADARRPTCPFCTTDDGRPVELIEVFDRFFHRLRCPNVGRPGACCPGSFERKTPRPNIRQVRELVREAELNGVEYNARPRHRV